MVRYVSKSDGTKEPFDHKKFKNSLKSAGATNKIIDEILQKVAERSDLNTTQQIYYFALEQLKKTARPIAARYNLKEALSQLGPSGFPLEKFIAQIFKYQGYQILVGQFVSGFCVDHEIDIVAQKEGTHAIIEVKFHANHTMKSDLKVALYVQARFQDLKKKHATNPKHTQAFHEAWLATNTKFTTEAIRYATCTQMNLLGWSYPAKNNLAHLIDKLGLHPITCLTSLNKKQKNELIKKGFVLCKDVGKHIKHLEQLGLSDAKIKQIQAEAEGVCSIV